MTFTSSALFAGIAFAGPLLAAAVTGQPAALLAPGMRLVYESGGQRSAWIVDSVRLDSVATCGRAWIRIGERAEERRDCVQDGALHRFDARAAEWREERPLAPNTERRYARARGTAAVFRTGAQRVDTIGTRHIPVVETTVITLDSTGTAVRRLRERYAVGLTTATWGLFEVADSTAPGGWRTQQEFRLVAIE